jgi:hypothetical protein
MAESTTVAQTAAVGAAILVAGVAVFQIALAAGLPLGEATWGGRAPTTDGALIGASRLVAAVSGLILIGIAWVVLARVGVVSSGPLSDTTIIRATWVIVGFLVLNTLANLTAPHPVERWVMGSITFVTAVLLVVVALRAP